LPSPPPRCCLSLPAVYTPPAKFPSICEVSSQLVHICPGDSQGQRPLQPQCLRAVGMEGPRGSNVPVSPGSDTPRAHHHGQASCDGMEGPRGDPSGTSGCLGTTWGHPCHCWSITEPLPSHRRMELNAWEVPQQGTMSVSAGPGDPSGQGRGQRHPQSPVPGCSGQEAGAHTWPVPGGSWPAAPTIINPVRPWQLWLSLIDRVGAEVLGRAGPVASPTPSAVPGKQAPGTAPCCQAGWHRSRALALGGLRGVQGHWGHCCREKRCLASAAEEGEGRASRQCSLFPPVSHHRWD